jgi:hypothetical protein
MRTDNGAPFASNGESGLTALSVWWIKPGIHPERIQPGKPQQNGAHERMHRTLKEATACPPACHWRAQQRRFDEFRREYNEQRPHQALGQTTPASHYEPSPREYPRRVCFPSPIRAGAMACGSKEFDLPLSRFPLRGKAGAGGFPPRRKHAASQQKTLARIDAAGSPHKRAGAPLCIPRCAACGIWGGSQDNRMEPIGLTQENRLHKSLDTAVAVPLRAEDQIQQSSPPARS